MSTFPNGFSQSPDDARLELAMAASRSERRNRPRIFLVLAIVILLIAVINLLLTFTQRAAAAASLSRARASLANVDGIVSQLENLVEKRDSPQYERILDLEGALIRFASDSGLGKIEVKASEPTGNLTGFRERHYQALITEADPEKLLKWVTEATNNSSKAFTGLEVNSFKLTPGRTLESGAISWTLDITFRRWERTS